MLDIDRAFSANEVSMIGNARHYWDEAGAEFRMTDPLSAAHLGIVRSPQRSTFVLYHWEGWIELFHDSTLDEDPDWFRSVVGHELGHAMGSSTSAKSTRS